MRLRFASLLLASALIVGVAGLPATASGSGPHYVAGAAGVGDPYYPLYGNGGYDVQHYGLKVAYDPGSDRLTGIATISARTTEGLYRSWRRDAGPADRAVAAVARSRWRC